MVRLDDIVGSVGRYRDFTRTYLPRSGANKARWTRLDAALNSLENLPPVELLKIGDAYFVRDGNHRTSVARANNLSHIEAYVTEMETDIPLTSDDFERDQWIIKIEYAEFLQETSLDRLRPDHHLQLTAPGRFAILLRHIRVHRYLVNQGLERAGSEFRLDREQAVMSWYDNIYMPVVRAIHQKELMSAFPNRTEADLYLWIAHHREMLARQYEMAPLSPEAAVNTFAETHSDSPLGRAIKGMKLGVHRALGQTEIPLGMSEEEFEEARRRHDAGDITLAEAETKDEQRTEESDQEATS